MPIYFLYARKSTDVEDKQVRSIEDQLAVLRALAQQEGFIIAEEFVEKQSAKVPGRHIFNEMLARIEKGEADGIICWKLDRLARNPIDAARIQWLLQEGVIKHIRTNDRSYYPSDNVLMMGFEFGMANQYIRDLSNNVKRGLIEKAKRGEFPSSAHIGYLNDVRTKRIIVDPHLAPIIRGAFELYAEGNSRLEDIGNYFFEHGLKTGNRSPWAKGGGRQFHKDKVKRILTDIFYIGLFNYSGEIYQGIHEPIIEKRLFDKVQAVLKARGKVHQVKEKPPALCRFLRCGECGGFITYEVINKHQKNGNIHHYTYYRCTKKRGFCPQPYIREEELNIMLSCLIADFRMPDVWAKEMLAQAEKDALEAKQVAMAAVGILRDKIVKLTSSIERLTDLYIGQDIERETYLERKGSLMSERKTAEEQIANLERDAARWLQPLKDWIKDAQMLEKIAETGTLESKKSVLLKIYGSNPVLKNSQIVSVPIPPYNTLLAARIKYFSDKEKPSEFKEGLSMVASWGFEPQYPR
jgi:site-specific DNA recombinase